MALWEGWGWAEWGWGGGFGSQRRRQHRWASDSECSSLSDFILFSCIDILTVPENAFFHLSLTKRPDTWLTRNSDFHSHFVSNSTGRSKKKQQQKIPNAPLEAFSSPTVPETLFFKWLFLTWFSPRKSVFIVFNFFKHLYDTGNFIDSGEIRLSYIFILCPRNIWLHSWIMSSKEKSTN